MQPGDVSQALQHEINVLQIRLKDLMLQINVVLNVAVEENQRLKKENLELKGKIVKNANKEVAIPEPPVSA